ncbi:hypothetical protein N7488_003442 [Penicillium malachiteum]|nr:hypothetical protein N7488_003442 [Penicillium malachiteum]
MNIEVITDYDWMRTTLYKASAAKGKQPDDALIPDSRRGPGNIHRYGWPTLVIETGLVETLPQLRNDAKCWFEMSNGDVRMVLLISLKQHTIEIELWQLAPVGPPAPSTQQYIALLTGQVPNTPPLI